MSALVADLMTRNPITAKPETNLLECAKIMVKKKVGSLPLVEKKKLVGFISQEDILWALVKKSKKHLEEIKAIDISPRKIATVRPSATIKEVMKRMKKLRFKKLPVVQEGEFMGIITVRDILSFHPELYPELDEFAKIREESKKLRRIRKAENIRDGICEECGNHDILQRFNGILVCESCYDGE